MVVNEDGSAETALIAMKSTQLKKSRKWNSMMQSVQMVGANGPFNPPRYSHLYEMKTVKEENSKGSWHGWEMSRVGPITDKSLYVRAKEFHDSISEGEVLVKHEQEEQKATKEVLLVAKCKAKPPSCVNHGPRCCGRTI